VLRLFVPEAPDEGVVRIPRAELKHLRVLRLGPGDRLCVFDDAGREHEVVLEQVTAREATGRVVGTSLASRESPLELVLMPALVKHDRMDWVVEKATELGVARIAPVVTRFSVARGDHGERWRRIATAAAKQCGRTRIPAVDAARPLDGALSESWPGLRRRAGSRSIRTRSRFRGRRIYARHRFVQRAVNRGVYPELPEETQLLWYKRL